MTAWKSIRRQNFHSWEALADFLQLAASDRQQILQHSDFPLNFPRRLAGKVQKGTLDDPILRQFLPLREELNVDLGFVDEPVQDSDFQLTPRLLKKYGGRALLLATSACAMHCRYCFRQNYPYEFPDHHFEEELEELKQDSSIQELILSGGDPLSLDDKVLARLFDGLEEIPHIKRVRFHTRFPIAIPERIDESFLEMLSKVKQQLIIVLHCNHERELGDDLFVRLKALQKLGIPLLNQAVLLKDVNDDLKSLKNLSEGLVNHGVMPYYLHQLDRVKGAQHFEVEETRGRELLDELESVLSGYAVPKYVREIPGKTSKTSIRNFDLHAVC